MLNRIVLHGRLVRAPELKTTTGELHVASFTVAVDRDFAPSSGEKQTDFVDCVAWRQTADFVSRYFAKGQLILLEGRLQSRKWQDKEGKNRVSWEVLADHVWFGEPKRAAGAPGESADGFTEEPPGSGEGNPFTGRDVQTAIADDDEDLPF